MNYGQDVVDSSYADRHPSTQNLIKWLVPNPNLPEGTPRDVAEEIWGVATNILMYVGDSPEITAGLRHLLEAKDCLVRAALDEQPGFWTDR